MMPSSLDLLQTGFQDYILGRSERALADVESTQALSARRRLDIYHNAYRVRLTELLTDTFERVVLYIGDAAFDTAARAYIEDHPPTARNLRDYGREFPAFLADRFPNDMDVAELAEMDSCLRYAFDAADAPLLGIADLAAVAPEDCDGMIFTLHPSVSILQFHWNTPALWQSLNEGAAPPPPKALAQREAWLFWRKDLQPHFRSLSAEEHGALRAIAEGQNFGTWCTMLNERHPTSDIPALVAGWLHTWIEDQLLESRGIEVRD